MYVCMYVYNRIATYDVCYMIITLYHQAKAPIDFWCKWGLNSRFLVEEQKT